MSESGRQNVGRPDAMVEAGYLIFRYCGGKGGGGCIDTLGATGIALEYRVSRHIVYNKRIIFENKDFFGVRIYTDAGPSGSCSHSLGSEVPFWMALSASPTMDGADVVANGVELSGDLPYEIEFDAIKMPQPTDPAWNNRIYVHLYWGNSGYLNGGAVSGAISENSFRIVKHDYDIKL